MALTGSVGLNSKPGSAPSAPTPAAKTTGEAPKETAFQSRSQPSPANQSSAPSNLPNPPARRGRPLGSRNRTSLEPETRKLPEEPAEFEAALKPYRIMVRPLVTGVSRLCEEVGSIPLDSDERQGGEQAFAALMYQYGGQLDARVLVALWVVGVTLPRVIHEVKKRDAKKKTPLTAPPAYDMPQREERVVTGIAVRGTP